MNEPLQPINIRYQTSDKPKSADAGIVESIQFAAAPTTMPEKERQ
jgi:hypothetical protein